MRRTDPFRLLPVIVLMIAGACYTYTPIQSPEQGMEVRAQLDTEAAVRRSQGLSEPILYYDGMVVDRTADAFALDVLVARSTTQFRDVEIRDTVQLQTTEIQSIMQRTISPVRTGLLVVGVAAGAFAVVKSIDAVVGGTGDDGGNGPPATAVVPVFSANGSGLRFLPLFRR